MPGGRGPGNRRAAPFLSLSGGSAARVLRPDFSRNRTGPIHRFSSLKACVQRFCRRPGMHQSMQSGSMARPASTLPMSSVSQPNVHGLPAPPRNSRKHAEVAPSAPRPATILPSSNPQTTCREGCTGVRSKAPQIFSRYFFTCFATNVSSTDPRSGFPTSCSSYITRTVGFLILMIRFRSIGVPIITTSHGTLLMVAARSLTC
jgi:hypothetical protein